MSDLKTARAYAWLDEKEKEKDLYRLRFEFLAELTPRAFTELQDVSRSTGLSMDVLIDGWINQL